MRHFGLLLVLVILAGCGGGGSGVSSGAGPANSPGAGPIVVDVTPLPEPPASARVGPEGGAVELIAGDGTRYLLEVPPLALAEPTDLTLTGAAVSGLPVSGPVLGAVQMGPPGLVFLRPAKLTVVPAGGFDPRAFIPVGIDEEGRAGLLLGQGFPDRLEFVILHFSYAAPAQGTPEEAALLAQALGGLEQAVGNVVAQSLMAEGGFTPATRSAAEEVLREYFSLVVKPLLEEASTEEGLDSALKAYVQWLALVDRTDFMTQVDGAPPLNGTERRQGRHLSITALRKAVDLVNERTRAQLDWTPATRLLYWSSLAQALSVDVVEAGDPPGPSLALGDIADRCAVRVIVEECSMPALVQEPLENFELETKAFLAIVDATGNVLRELRDLPITVKADLLGGTPEDIEAQTDPARQNVFRTSLQLAARSTHAAGEVEFLFPPVQVPIRTVRQVRTDGAVRLTWIGGEEVEPGGTLDLVLKVEKGRGVASYKQVTLGMNGDGSVAPQVGTTNADGLLNAVFTAPPNPTTTEVEARFTDLDNPAQPVEREGHTIRVGLSSPLFGTYYGRHAGVDFGHGPESEGPVTVSISGDRLSAHFQVNGQYIYIFGSKGPPVVSGSQVASSGLVAYCGTCFGFPGNFTAVLQADGKTLVGTVTRDASSVTFSATKQP